GGNADRSTLAEDFFLKLIQIRFPRRIGRSPCERAVQLGANLGLMEPALVIWNALAQLDDPDTRLRLFDCDLMPGILLAEGDLTAAIDDPHLLTAHEISPLLSVGGSLDRCRPLWYDIDNGRKTLRNESQSAGGVRRVPTSAGPWLVPGGR